MHGRGSLRMVARYRAAWNTSRGLMELLAREEDDDVSALRLSVLCYVFSSYVSQFIILRFLFSFKAILQMTK